MLVLACVQGVLVLCTRGPGVGSSLCTRSWCWLYLVYKVLVLVLACVQGPGVGSSLCTRSWCWF